MNHLEFDFETETREQQEQLVALLNNQGFDGFEEDEHSLKAYVPEDAFDESSFREVLELFSTISYIKTTVEKENWNQKWEADFKPVVILDFVALRAGFHKSITGVKHEIIITPKMSFGTGHHSTTQLMIQQMQKLDFQNKTVFDFGTGTGVLAILAEKLGALSTLAVDYDEWSIINAKENIETNKCRAVEVAMMDKVPPGKEFDIILANINLNIILQSMSSIANGSKAGAYVVLSGFLQENESAITDSFMESGLQFINTLRRGDWISVLAKKTG